MLRTLLRKKPTVSELSGLRSTLRSLTGADWVYEDVDTMGPTGQRIRGTFLVSRLRDTAAVDESVAPIYRVSDILKKHGLLADYYAGMGGSDGTGIRLLVVTLQAARHYEKSRKSLPALSIVAPQAFVDTVQERGKFGDTVAMASFDDESPAHAIANDSQLDARAALMPALQQLAKGTKIDGHTANWQLGEGTHNEFWLLASDAAPVAKALSARNIAYEIHALGAHNLVTVAHTADLAYKLNTPLATIEAPLLTREQLRIDLPPDHSLPLQR